MSDSAYILYYKGVQLGDEAFLIAPGLDFTPARIDRLFRSPLAAIHRPTTGKAWTYRFQVHLIKSDPVAVGDQIDQWDALATDEAGTIELYQGAVTPVLQKTIADAWLQRIDPRMSDEPSRARITPVMLEFATTTRPT